VEEDVIWIGIESGAKGAGRVFNHSRVSQNERSARQFAKKFLLVHPILERFTSVDKNNWDLVVELAAQSCVCVHVHFAPDESATSGKLGEALLDHLAKVASLTGIHDDVA
jgi:hypothetical protein